jgi:hypothetical protein
LHIVTAILKPHSFVGRVCHHALNRGNGGEVVFHKPRDYDALVAELTEKRYVPLFEFSGRGEAGPVAERPDSGEVPWSARAGAIRRPWG